MAHEPPYVAALVVAAGSGVRMGIGTSKVLLQLGAETILERSVNAFLSIECIDEIVIVCRLEDQPQMRTLPYRNPRALPISFVTGGRVRQESVFNGLEFLSGRLLGERSSYVAVHDAARCFIRPETIRRSVKAALAHEAVTVAVRLVDSIKRVSVDGRVESSLSRDNVWCIQTPQVFRFEILFEAHRRSTLTVQGQGASDDAALVEALRPVYVSEGDRSNFKVTTPEDYEIARSLVALEGAVPTAAQARRTQEPGQPQQGTLSSASLRVLDPQ